MADVASKLKVSELDFDAIKSNLKNFLGDQNELSDYNFDGSAMAVLMDLLAYNTHYNAFYLNMIVNEMFLDTASLRNSVVSRAKHLGYTPTSVRGAKAYVDLTITPANTPTNIVIAKDTQFNATVNGISYIFSTSNSVTVTFEYPPTVPIGVNVFAPFGAPASAIKDFKTTILPVVKALPTVPSPKYTLYLLSVSSSKKYTLAVELIEVVSFATE